MGTGERVLGASDVISDESVEARGGGGDGRWAAGRGRRLAAGPGARKGMDEEWDGWPWRRGGYHQPRRWMRSAAVMPFVLLLSTEWQRLFCHVVSCACVAAIVLI